MSLDRLLATNVGGVQGLHDIQDGPAGGFVEADELANKIIMSYSIEIGSWEGDPTLGHGFAELARAIDTVETRQRLGDLAVAAVQWLLDSGELSSIEVDVMTYAPGIVAFRPRCYQPGSKRPIGGVGLQLVSVGGR